MATVYQRKGRACWLVDYTDSAGKRVAGKRLPDSVTTKRQAEAAARAIEAVVGAERAPLPGMKRAVDALDDWLADREARRSAATVRYYRKHAHNFGALPLSRPLSALTPSVLSAYLTARAKAASPQTSDKERTTLHAWLRWCVRRGLLEHNPVEAVDRFGAPPAQQTPADRLEVARLLRGLWRAREGALDATQHAHAELCYLLRLLWWSGQRIGQLCAIRRADVDLDAEAITFIDSKRKYKPRVWSIPRQVVRLVRRLHARGYGTLLATQDGLPYYNAAYLALARWRKDHPEARAIRFHSFRHAYSTRGDDAGLDRAVKSKDLMGHETLQMTERYTHRVLERQRREQDRLARVEAESRRPPPKD